MVSEPTPRLPLGSSRINPVRYEETPADKQGLKVDILPMNEQMLTLVCDLHLEAFPDVMSTRLGRAYLQAFMAWFVNSSNAIALVAVTEQGRIVGYVVGAPIGYTAVLNRELAGVAARSMIARPWLLLNWRILGTLKARLGFMFGSTAGDASGLPTPAMSLVGIATAPSESGRGVGLALMQGFEREARALKMASLRLSVYPGNLGAKRLYERCGWRELPGAPTASGTVYYGRIIQ